MRCLVVHEYYTIRLDNYKNHFYNRFCMVIKMKFRSTRKVGLEEGARQEAISFTKDQFDKLLQKNLKMPVSIVRL